jgi:hypothetical protein
LAGPVSLVCGCAPSAALPGLPSIHHQLRQVYDRLTAAQTAISAGRQEDSRVHVQAAMALLSALNFEAMWLAALQSVDVYVHPLFVPGEDTRVDAPLKFPRSQMKREVM